MLIKTLSLRFPKNEEHAKRIAEPQINKKSRTIQPQKLRIKTNIGNYAIFRQIYTDSKKNL